MYHLRMQFPVPNPTLDPANFKSLRPQDDITPAVANQVGAVLKNLKTGGPAFVGNVRMPMDQYLAGGGPVDVPVFVEFLHKNGTDYVSARSMADAFNNGFAGGVGVAYGAFDGVAQQDVVGYTMTLFPELLDAHYKALEVIAMKGV